MYCAGRQHFTDFLPTLARVALCYDDLILPILPPLLPVLFFGSRRRGCIFLVCTDILVSSLELLLPSEFTSRFGSTRQVLTNLLVVLTFLAKRNNELVLPLLPFLPSSVSFDVFEDRSRRWKVL